MVEFNGKAWPPLDVAREELDEFLDEKSSTCLEKGDMVILRKRINMGMGDRQGMKI